MTPIELARWFDGRVLLLRFPSLVDARGRLTEFDETRLPFAPRRSFVVQGVPAGVQRGGHAHLRGQQLLTCLAGSIEVELLQGESRHQVRLAAPTEGLLIGAGIWARQRYSGPEAILLVLASDPFDPASYVAEPA